MGLRVWASDKVRDRWMRRVCPSADSDVSISTPSIPKSIRYLLTEYK